MAISTLITNVTRPPLRDQSASAAYTWGNTELCYAWDWAQKLAVSVLPAELLKEFNKVALFNTAAIESGMTLAKFAFPTDLFILRGLDIRASSAVDFKRCRFEKDEARKWEYLGGIAKATASDPVVIVFDAIYYGPTPGVQTNFGKAWYTKEPALIDEVSDSLEINDVLAPNLNPLVLSWAWHKVNQTERSAAEWNKGIGWLRAAGARWEDLEKLAPPWAGPRQRAA